MVKELIRRWYHRRHYIEDKALRQKFQTISIAVTVSVIIIHTIQIVYYLFNF